MPLICEKHASVIEKNCASDQDASQTCETRKHSGCGDDRFGGRGTEVFVRLRQLRSPIRPSYSLAYSSLNPWYSDTIILNTFIRIIAFLSSGYLLLQAVAAVGSQPTKTPVSVLQELCVKRHITPKYDLIQIEGSVHEPTFKYRVTVGEYVGEWTLFLHFLRRCNNAYACLILWSSLTLRLWICSTRRSKVILLFFSPEHGTGQSKKKAKHAAAKAVLDRLIGNSGTKKGSETVDV